MASSISIPRTHLIMAVCLPLAVLLGYFLAEPLDSANMMVVVMVLAVLSVPMLMRWHHPLLVLSWNTWMAPAFLPGQPALWMIVALGSLLFAVFNRSARAGARVISLPPITRALLFLLGVVLLTAALTGGIGLKSFGGRHYGGKAYFCILM